MTERLRTACHPIKFLDIGGGFPVRYLQSRSQWESFSARIDQQLQQTNTETIALPGSEIGRVGATTKSWSPNRTIRIGSPCDRANGWIKSYRPTARGPRLPSE